MHLCSLQTLLDKTRAFDFLGPLALRLYLVPVFWMAGNNKFVASDNTLLGLSLPMTNYGLPIVKQDIIDWFGNKEWGLGLPWPDMMAYLAAYTEFFGALLLLVGLAVRWISIPLMITMLVAAFSVHWQNGWQAIADPLSCLFNCADANDAVERLAVAKDILQQHGNYDWLTGQGSIGVINNGIEFAATYFVMLLALFFIGSGKYLSIDYWIAKRCAQ